MYSWHPGIMLMNVNKQITDGKSLAQAMHAHQALTDLNGAVFPRLKTLRPYLRQSGCTVQALLQNSHPEGVNCRGGHTCHTEVCMQLRWGYKDSKKSKSKVMSHHYSFCPFPHSACSEPALWKYSSHFLLCLQDSEVKGNFPQRDTGRKVTEGGS